MSATRDVAAGALFRLRLERLYREVTGAVTAHGAQTWFALEARVTSRAVRRWVAGERPVDGPVLALLERMERDLTTTTGAP